MAEPLAFAAYVDGFNLYHAIDQMREPHLKWLNIYSLCSGLASGFGGHAGGGGSLVSVKWFTALPDWPSAVGSRARHRIYQAVLEGLGVQAIHGHFRKEWDKCKKCGATRPAEKETDVNIALHLVKDAEAGLFRKAILVTGDSDQVPTVRRVIQRLGPGSVHVVAPPGRDIPYHLQAVAGGKSFVVKLHRPHLVRNLLGDAPLDGAGRTVQRPPEYAPPP